MEDTSLDEFLSETGEAGADGTATETREETPDREDDRPGESAEDSSDNGDAGDGAEGQSDDDRKSRAGVASTYAWDPDGGACAACGDAVAERWRDDAGLVCGSCKDW